RNYIEGLFLSSGIFKNADFTMERLLRIVKRLRTEERYNGYIHLKTIPGASEELIREAGMYVDRMSINLEVPTESGLKIVAPEKDHDSVKKPLAFVNQQMQAFEEEKKLIKNVPTFVPAGQSTQLVVGATPDTDFDILRAATDFYKAFGLKRVYYSGYIPINDDHASLPQIGSAPPLLRENRLYQTDWLLRFYDFRLDELLDPASPNLDLAVDPKLAWALRNPAQFPVDVNHADYRDIVRVPGIGIRSARKIVQARRFGRLYEHQLRKMGLAFNRARHFITYADAPVALGAASMENVRKEILATSNGNSRLLAQPTQLSLF